MESVPAPDRDSDKKYLDDNAERFDPSPKATPVAGETAFRERIEGLARDLGFVRIGFAPAEPFVEAGRRFKDWLGQGHAGTMSYLAEFGERHLPGRLLANARSVVVAAAAVPSPAQREPNGGGPRGRVADYALGLDYHIALRSRLRRIGQGLADGSGRSVWTRPCIDTAPLLEREAARLAGIGFIAKSTMLIVPGIGPRVLLAALVTDLELWPGEPLESRCGRCTACLDACPTQAFVAPYQLDARRCVSYLNIEHQGAIDPMLREKMGTRLFGCDECQSACPYDRADAAHVMPTDASPRPHLVEPDLLRWLEMTSTDYRRITKRSALRRVGRTQLMRNAAIGLGNSGVGVAVPPLVHALESNPSAVVRAQVAWALGRLSGTAAENALRRALASEKDHVVRDELAAALRRLSAPRLTSG
jgi:epoxyqueuosine reductase